MTLLLFHIIVIDIIILADIFTNVVVDILIVAIAAVLTTRFSLSSPQLSLVSSLFRC